MTVMDEQQPLVFPMQQAVQYQSSSSSIVTTRRQEQGGDPERSPILENSTTKHGSREEDEPLREGENDGHVAEQYFMDMSPPSNFIDNSTLVYIPMRLRCGVTLCCRPDVLTRCPAVLTVLDEDIKACLQVLPRSVHALVKRTKIWINTTYCYGPMERPQQANHSTAHHHEAWLLLVRDNPAKALGLEIYNCFDYMTMRLHWNGCGLVLHELCHLIHQLALSDGLENEMVKEAYQRASNAGKYEKVLRRDWAGLHVEYDMAYAMVNFKEFFAEMSVTYLSDAYQRLNKITTNMDRPCSPILMQPMCISRVQAQQGRVVDKNSKHYYTCLDYTKSNYNIRLSHCNKFFPFTRGQLQQYDPETFEYLDKLWSEIRCWEDEYDTTQTCCLFPFLR